MALTDAEAFAVYEAYFRAQQQGNLAPDVSDTRFYTQNTSGLTRDQAQRSFAEIAAQQLASGNPVSVTGPLAFESVREIAETILGTLNTSGTWTSAPLDQATLEARLSVYADKMIEDFKARIAADANAATYLPSTPGDYITYKQSVVEAAQDLSHLRNYLGRLQNGEVNAETIGLTVNMGFQAALAVAGALPLPPQAKVAVSILSFASALVPSIIELAKGDGSPEKIGILAAQTVLSIASFGVSDYFFDYVVPYFLEDPQRLVTLQNMLQNNPQDVLNHYTGVAIEELGGTVPSYLQGGDNTDQIRASAQAHQIVSNLNSAFDKVTVDLNTQFGTSNYYQEISMSVRAGAAAEIYQFARVGSNTHTDNFYHAGGLFSKEAWDYVQKRFLPNWMLSTNAASIHESGGVFVLETGSTVTQTSAKDDSVFAPAGNSLLLLAGDDTFTLSQHKDGGPGRATFYDTLTAGSVDGGAGHDILDLVNVTKGAPHGRDGDLVIDTGSVKWIDASGAAETQVHLLTHSNFETIVAGNLASYDMRAATAGVKLITQDSFDRFGQSHVWGSGYADTLIIDTARFYGGSYNGTNWDQYQHHVTGNQQVAVHAGAGNDYVAGELVDGATYDGGTGHDTFEILASDGSDGAVTTFLDLQSGASSQVRSVWWYGTNYVTSDTTATVTNFEWAVGSQLTDTIYALNSGSRIQGAGGNDVLHGRGGRDQLLGDAGNDALYGNGGVDRLEGGAGNDALYGGAGNDVLIGGAGNDTLVDAEGANLIDGGSGNDNISVGNTANEIHGGAGNDTIASGNLANLIYGGAHEDVITAGTGHDTIDAGDQDDRVTVTGGNNRIALGHGVDVLRAGAGDDTVTDTYTSLQHAGLRVQNDIARDSSYVYLDGGAGHDTLSIDYGGAAITFADEAVFQSSSFSYTFRTGVREQFGSHWEWNNPATPGHGGGKWVLDYETQHIANFEELHLTNGTFTVDLIAFADLEGDFWPSIEAHEIHNRIQTWNNDDTVHLGAGNDTFFASLGNDTVAGEENTDWLDFSRLGAGYSVDAIVLDGTGAGTITIRDAANAVAGTVTASTFEAVTGTAGAESITMGGGANHLRGLAGNDTLAGGAGGDRFYFGTADGADTITDAAIGDVLVFEGPDGTAAPVLARTGTAGAYSYTVTFGTTTVTFADASLLDLNVTSATTGGQTTWQMAVVDGRIVAAADSGSTDEDTAVTIDVLANDTDPGLANAQITAFDATSAKGASVARVGTTGQFTYDPGAVFDGLIDGQSDTDTFSYTLSDGTTTRTATVTVAISGFTDNPVAYDDAAAVLEDASVTINAKANDLDPGAADSTVTAFDATSVKGASITHQGNGVFQYTPGSALAYLGAGQVLTDSFTYAISDTRYTSTATVTVTVTGQDDDFTLVNDSRVVLEDHVATLNVLANDSDPDANDTLTLSAVGTPNVGTAEIVAGQIRYTPQTNYNGPVSFTYDATDGRTTKTASVNLTYVAVDDPVTIVNDSYTFTSGRGPHIMDVTANDVDPEGGNVNLWIASAAATHYGAVSIVDNKIHWTPAAGIGPGSYQMGYAVRDDAGHITYNGEVTVTLVAEQAPNVFNNSVALYEDQPYLFRPEWQWQNSDPNGDTVSLVSLTHNMTNATVTDNGDKTFTITPNKDWYGTEYATVTLTDGVNEVSYVQSFWFRNTPDPVIAAPDVLRTAPNTTLRFADTALSANDASIDGYTNGWMVTLAGAQNGTLGAVAGHTTNKYYAESLATFAGWQIVYDERTGGDALFTPTPGFHGEASFKYKYLTDLGTSYAVSVGDVTVVVDTDVAAVADSVTVAEDTPVTHNVLTNDSDADGDTMILHKVDGVTNGSVSFTDAGAITYTPDANWSGTEVLTYHVGSSYQPVDAASTATLTITVTPVDDPVVAQNDSVTTTEDTGVVVDFLGNDTNPEGRASAVTAVGTPSNGVLSQTGGQYTYTPNADWNGTDSFSYTREDGFGGTTSATVTLTVTPVQDAPVAANDAVTTNEDTPTAINVLANDVDADGETLTITALGTPGHGSVFVAPDGMVIYTPDANFHGADSFSYTLSDGTVTTTGTVNVTVAPVNDVPTHSAIHVTGTEDTPVSIDVTPYLSDIDGDTVTIDAAGTPANGTVTFQGNVLTFTPNADWNGTEANSFSVTDGQSGLSVPITYTVTPTPDAPDARADTVTVNAGGTTAFAVLANDVEPDGETLTITHINGAPIITGQTVALGGGGSVALGEGNVLTIGSGAGHQAMKQGETKPGSGFSYTVTDPTGRSSTATVDVTIAGVNDLPAAINDSLTTKEDTAVTLNLLANDSDIDGDAITLKSVATPTHGAVSFAADGALTYTPKANWHGSESFTYTLRDAKGAEVTGTVSVSVTPVNDAPTYAVPAGFIPAHSDSGTTLDLSGVSFSDIDSTDITVTVSTTHGSISSFAAPASLTVRNDNHKVISITGKISDVQSYLHSNISYSDPQGSLPNQKIDVVLTVQDADGSTVQTLPAIPLDIANENDAVRINGTVPAQTGTEDVALTLDFGDLGFADDTILNVPLVLTLGGTHADLLTGAAATGVTLGRDGAGALTITALPATLTSYLQGGNVTFTPPANAFGQMPVFTAVISDQWSPAQALPDIAVTLAANPVADTPTLTVAGTTRYHTENTPMALEPNLTVTSPDLGPLNGGQGDHSGATVQVFSKTSLNQEIYSLANMANVTANRITDVRWSLDTADGKIGELVQTSTFMIVPGYGANAHLQVSEKVVTWTFTFGGTATPTTALVQEVLRAVQYDTAAENWTSFRPLMEWVYTEPSGEKSHVTTDVYTTFVQDPRVFQDNVSLTTSEDTGVNLDLTSITSTDPDGPGGNPGMTFSVQHGTLSLRDGHGLGNYLFTSVPAPGKSISLEYLPNPNVGQYIRDYVRYTPDANFNGTDTLTVQVTPGPYSLYGAYHYLSYDIAVAAENDAAVIGGDLSAKMTEAGTGVAGRVTVADIDGPNQMQAAQLTGAYGTLEIVSGGGWSYARTADLTHLDQGQTVTDSFAVAAADGTAAQIDVTIHGLAEGQAVTGTEASEALTGGAGRDTVSGAGGDDTLTGGAGDDHLTGGAGEDWAHWSGNSADFGFAWQSGTLVVTDRNRADGDEGADRVAGDVEYLLFGDGAKARLADTPQGNGLFFWDAASQGWDLRLVDTDAAAVFDATQGTQLSVTRAGTADAGFALSGRDADKFSIDATSGKLQFTGAAPSKITDYALTIADAVGVSPAQKQMVMTFVPGLIKSGSAADDALKGADKADLFFVGRGADVAEGGGGDDVFRLSATETDATWGADRYTYAQQVNLSSGKPLSATLTGRVRVDDAFLGGSGADKLEGTDLGEAILLFDPNYSATNSALQSFNARVIGIESFALGGGDDILDLTSGADQQGFVADAWIDGGAGNDFLWDGAGSSTLIGGSGLDRLLGGRGDDVMTGGAQGGTGDGTEDRFVFAPALGGGTDRITDFELGTDKIWLLGFGVSGVAAAQAGGHLSWTSDGTDTTVAITGQGQTTKVVLQGVGSGLSATDFFVYDEAPKTPTDPGTNPTPITGTDGDDQQTGTGQHDTFVMGRGADIAEGLGGNDIFQLSATEHDAIWEASRYTYAQQVQLANGTPYSAMLSGKIRVDDTFLGGAGYDKVLGTDLGEAILLFDPNFSGTNSILANYNARIIGIEEIDLGGGDDIIDLTSGADQQGYIADVRLVGGAGDDFLLDGAGNSTLVGGQGQDRLLGWRGDDVLTGGEAGGTGDGVEDRFVFSAATGGGHDRITDFEDGIDDLWMIGFGVGTLAEAQAAGIASIETTGGDTQLTLTSGGKTTTVLFEGFTGELGADDLLFFA